MCSDKPERGSSLAWAAVFPVAVVVVPLMLLVGDGARLWYVPARGLLRRPMPRVCGRLVERGRPADL